MTTETNTEPETSPDETRSSFEEREAHRGDNLARNALARYHATSELCARERSFGLGKQVSKLIDGLFEGYRFDVPAGANSLTVGGLTFMLCGTQTCLVGVCPDCGTVVVSDHVMTMEHLGQLIQKFVPHANHRRLIHGENP